LCTLLGETEIGLKKMISERDATGPASAPPANDSAAEVVMRLFILDDDVSIERLVSSKTQGAWPHILPITRFLA
jgi:hypothetical protein